MSQNIKTKLNTNALSDTNYLDITSNIQIDAKLKISYIPSAVAREVPLIDLITVLPPSSKDYAEISNLDTSNEEYKIFGTTIDYVTDIILLLHKADIDKYIIIYESSSINTIDFINNIYFYNNDRNRNRYTIKLSQTIVNNTIPTTDDDPLDGSLFDSEVLNLYDIIINNNYTSTTTKDVLISIIEKMISF